MDAETAVPQIDPSAAIALIERGALLIDVREDDEWQAGHAPAALHIPLGELGDRIGEVDAARTLLIICRSGRRSDQAAAALRRAGYDAANLSGGMQAWQAAGGRVISSAGGQGAVI